MSENEHSENMESNLEPSATPQKAPASKKTKDKTPVKKKMGLIQRFSKFLREMKSELKKVAWPNKNQTFKNTLVVIVCVIFVGFFIWIFDGIAGGLISALLALFGG
ncbi:MAG: preprotein translocase subunit SecE [Evtepia sp.]